MSIRDKIYNYQPFWFIILAVLIAGFGYGVWYYQSHQNPTIDALECPAYVEPPAHTIVVIDQSDPFSKADLEWVERLVRIEGQGLPHFGRLTVLGLMSEVTEPTSNIFTRCSPGNPTDVDALTQNRNFIRRDWEQEFAKPLNDSLDRALTIKVQPRSPIVEAIASVVQRADFTDAVHTRTIVVISDMMQNSANFSFYNTSPNVAVLKKRALWQDVPTMQGIDVIVHLVTRRQNGVSKNLLISFWKQLLTSKGATVAFE